MVPRQATWQSLSFYVGTATGSRKPANVGHAVKNPPAPGVLQCCRGREAAEIPCLETLAWRGFGSQITHTSMSVPAKEASIKSLFVKVVLGAGLRVHTPLRGLRGEGVRAAFGFIRRTTLAGRPAPFEPYPS